MKVTPTLRATIATRDGARCARCSISIINIPSSIHHRKARGMGGTSDPRSSDPRNLVTVCGTGTTGCHGEIESFRAVAYDTGWLIRSYDDLDKRMLSLDGRIVHLFADGDRFDEITPESVLAASAYVGDDGDLRGA